MVRKQNFCKKSVAAFYVSLNCVLAPPKASWTRRPKFINTFFQGECHSYDCPGVRGLTSFHLRGMLRKKKKNRKEGKTMNTTRANHSTVIRTERGLTIAGTRITLYNVMDSLKANWPPTLIQAWLGLTDQQMQGALDYIDAHREYVETEYQLVLRQAEESRRYWEERNRRCLADIAARPPRPGTERLRAKLHARKTELGMS
jgi:uncharacterized protein (DUF433 family)